MRKINIITDYPKQDELSLAGIYGVETLTKSRTVGNLVDLISDVDLLVELGYEGYLSNRRKEFSRLEDVIDDTMHIRNLYDLSCEEYDALSLEERMAYVRRADMKVEIQFIETNQWYLESIIKILSKINKFNEVKNTRTYVPRILTQYEYIIDSDR